MIQEEVSLVATELAIEVIFLLVGERWPREEASERVEFRVREESLKEVIDRL